MAQIVALDFSPGSARGGGREPQMAQIFKRCGGAGKIVALDFSPRRAGKIAALDFSPGRAGKNVALDFSPAAG
jgi:hypothetical protein